LQTVALSSAGSEAGTFRDNLSWYKLHERFGRKIVFQFDYRESLKSSRIGRHPTDLGARGVAALPNRRAWNAGSFILAAGAKTKGKGTNPSSCKQRKPIHSIKRAKTLKHHGEGKKCL
jgi:hypothetical protein